MYAARRRIAIKPGYNYRQIRRRLFCYMSARTPETPVYSATVDDNGFMHAIRQMRQIVEEEWQRTLKRACVPNVDLDLFVMPESSSTEVIVIMIATIKAHSAPELQAGRDVSLIGRCKIAWAQLSGNSKAVVTKRVHRLSSKLVIASVVWQRNYYEMHHPKREVAATPSGVSIRRQSGANWMRKILLH